MDQDDARPAQRSQRTGFRPAALDALNLALVDVNGAIKPYLNVYLYVKRDWSDGAVGLVGTVAGLVGILFQAPLGAAIDAVRDKRLVLLAALIALAVATAVIAVAPHFWPVLIASTVLAVAGAILSPAVAALTLGLVPRRQLTRRLGRNAALERTGNVVIALLIGGIGWLLPDRAVFLLVPALCIVAAAALFSIPRRAIDARRARGETEGNAGTAPASLRTLLGNRPLVVFAVCVGLFHFANAPLLTLVAQEVGRDRPEWSSVIVSVCIVGAQIVMVPMAVLVGRRADRWGHKPLLLAAFVALPLRALLYTLWRDPIWLIAVQFLDGVGAGLLSASKSLVLADVMRGTGRYNLAQGLVGTLQGAGAALSFVVAGSLVQHAGFQAAYLVCGGVALLALALLWLAMPETATERAGSEPAPAGNA
ncbi:MFS transporter [Methylobacterium sp. J-072]|uniref:MFS transporter n=1 Tax=Methylobacterium sp. J-072 TaxID=2836651 RepID=UPI001FBB62E7|nr:MFS transporter [Methylobacterium sp. J-072]MCJ2095837.1 MFS transporter [Methylobacterium sp. J-072]